MQQSHSALLYADQRRFLARLAMCDRRITPHLGRLESRTVDNPVAEQLEDYLMDLQRRQIRIDKTVFHDLLDLAQRHRRTSVLVEKAVDVMLAID